MEVYDAINRVRDWWIGEVEGTALAEGSVFTYEYKPYHRTVQQVVELVPGKRIVWETLQSIHFLDSKTGWAAGDFGTVVKTVTGGAAE